MSFDSRLGRMMSGLTARERALLILQAWKQGKLEDPLWRRTMPYEQTEELNRLITLMNACNVYLPLYITMVEQHTEQLYLRFSWLLTLGRFGNATWELAELLPASRRAQAEKLVAGVYPAVELAWDPEEHADSWLGVTERGQAALRTDLVGLWQELKAIDTVLDEVAQEFNGEDPLRPVMRSLVEKTRRRLTDLHELLGAVEPLELPDADPEALELARAYFDNGRRLMASI